MTKEKPLCYVCKQPAVVIDGQFPYERSRNRCNVHRNVSVFVRHQPSGARVSAKEFTFQMGLAIALPAILLVIASVTLYLLGGV